ncbi:MAG: hypothetical protein GF341_05220 [candidate division Zixibacteria bacterium]|nr:hypothetical protein [candidate division Zixibacteria bacterium]
MTTKIKTMGDFLERCQTIGKKPGIDIDEEYLLIGMGRHLIQAPRYRN